MCFTRSQTHRVRRGHLRPESVRRGGCDDPTPISHPCRRFVTPSVTSPRPDHRQTVVTIGRHWSYRRDPQSEPRVEEFCRTRHDDHRGMTQCFGLLLRRGREGHDRRLQSWVESVPLLVPSPMEIGKVKSSDVMFRYLRECRDGSHTPT